VALTLCKASKVSNLSTIIAFLQAHYFYFLV
jgi:hypothetical protein